MSKSDFASVQAQSEAMLINQDEWPKYTGYSPLVENRNEIRLLKLEPLAGTGPLTYSLYAVSLDDRPDFCTLSYYWGAPVPRRKLKEIRIRKSKVLIRPTLELFLQNLAQEAPTTYLWLDVLCIDQQNLVERSRQVARMGDIYKAARTTYVWLGEGNADTDYACEYIRNGGNPETSTELKTIEGYIEQFLWRPYWRRMWVVQEFSLSKSVIIMIGDQCVQWEQLDEVLTRVFPVSQKAVISNRVGQEQPSSTVWTGYSQMRTARQNSSSIGKPLLDLMWQFRNQQCVDQRDKVYGLLAMADELILSPDYGISLTQLYFRVLAALRPPCDMELWREYGRRIFETINYEYLVRRCLAPRLEEMVKALSTISEHQFSHICRFEGIVAMIDGCGTGRQPWPVSSVGIPGHTQHAWVLRPSMTPNEEALLPPCSDSTFRKCLEANTFEPKITAGAPLSATDYDLYKHGESEYKSPDLRHLHISNKVEAGDLVFDSGVYGFVVIVRDGQVVDIGLRTELIVQPFSGSSELLPTEYVLLAKEMLLSGIRACEKGLHLHADLPVVEDIPSKFLFFDALFHIDRFVLTLLLITSQRGSTANRHGLSSSFKNSLFTFLSTSVSARSNRSTEVYSKKQRLLSHYRYINGYEKEYDDNFAPLDLSDSLEFIAQEQVSRYGESTFNNRQSYHNRYVLLLRITKTMGITQWQNWRFKSAEVLFHIGVLLTYSIEKDELLWELGLLDHSIYDYPDELEKEKELAAKAGRLSRREIFHDTDYIERKLSGEKSKHQHSSILYSLESSEELKLNDKLILTAQHRTAPYSSQIDLKAFLCNHNGELDWIRVLLTYDSQVSFHFDQPVPQDTKNAATGEEEATTSVNDGNLSKISRNAGMIGRHLRIELLQPNQTWKTCSIVLANRIVWMENGGLKFLFLSSPESTSDGYPSKKVTEMIIKIKADYDHRGLPCPEDLLPFQKSRYDDFDLQQLDDPLSAYRWRSFWPNRHHSFRTRKPLQENTI